MARLFEKVNAEDYMSLKGLFAFKGAHGMAPASVVDASAERHPGQREALDALLARGAVVRKGGDYVWDWTMAKKEGMARLGRALSEAFRYTGDWERDFDEHPIMPDVVADSVAGQDVELQGYLLKKFADVYKSNRGWAERVLNGRGDSGRDALYAFMRHWVDAKKMGR